MHVQVQRSRVFGNGFRRDVMSLDAGPEFGEPFRVGDKVLGQGDPDGFRVRALAAAVQRDGARRSDDLIQVATIGLIKSIDAAEDTVQAPAERDVQAGAAPPAAAAPRDAARMTPPSPPVTTDAPPRASSCPTSSAHSSSRWASTPRGSPSPMTATTG